MNVSCVYADKCKNLFRAFSFENFNLTCDTLLANQMGISIWTCNAYQTFTASLESQRCNKVPWGYSFWSL